MQNMTQFTDIYSEYCMVETTKCSTRTIEICGELSYLFEHQLCKEIHSYDELNFYHGLSTSTMNMLLCTIAWLTFVILWPLKHWALKVAFTNAKLDLLMHR